MRTRGIVPVRGRVPGVIGVEASCVGDSWVD